MYKEDYEHFKGQIKARTVERLHFLFDLELCNEELYHLYRFLGDLYYDVTDLLVFEQDLSAAFPLKLKVASCFFFEIYFSIPDEIEIRDAKGRHTFFQIQCEFEARETNVGGDLYGSILWKKMMLSANMKLAGRKGLLEDVNFQDTLIKAREFRAQYEMCTPEQQQILKTYMS